MCEETLAYNLAVDTVCNVLILADLHNAQNLKSIAIDFTNRYVYLLLFSRRHFWIKIPFKLSLFLVCYWLPGVIRCNENESASNNAMKN